MYSPMQRPTRWIAAAACAVTAIVLTVFLASNAEASDQQRVKYLGHTFTVPKGWQVVDLAAHPQTCVRFDRHVLYLGKPSADQDCPARAVGRTEAVLVQPADGATATGSSDDAVAQQITAGAGNVKVTATYDRDRGTARRVVQGAGFAAPRVAAPRTATSHAATAAPATVSPAVAYAATTFTGKGFDACTAPSSTAMNAWLASPYRAVGIYFGGAYRACAQPNLTAAWVAQQAAAGWHFLPLYVGPQALYNQITSPASQGAAAADDAANQAALLGFGLGTPLYYDMEAYPASQRANALAFASAWTTELHVHGYASGYYSSSNSGIADLVNNRSSYAMPDVLDIANWNNVADTNDANVPAGLWANHRRIHQYTGGQTEAWAGVSINIDHDYLDVALWPPVGASGSPIPIGGAPGSTRPSCGSTGPSWYCQAHP
jgi:Domain of unknown function (DUF1906)